MKALKDRWTFKNGASIEPLWLSLKVVIRKNQNISLILLQSVTKRSHKALFFFLHYFGDKFRLLI